MEISSIVSLTNFKDACDFESRLVYSLAVDRKTNALQDAALKHTHDERINSECLISHEVVDNKASADKRWECRRCAPHFL